MSYANHHAGPVHHVTTPVTLDEELLETVRLHLALEGHELDRVIAAALLQFIDSSPMAQHHTLELLRDWELSREAVDSGVIARIGRL